MVDISKFSRVDYWSFTAVPIAVDKDGTELSQGSAFFYQFGQQIYLVTAWHVVSGRHFQTGQSLASTGAWPTHLTIWWNSIDQLDEPLWLEIKQDDYWIDVALLPVSVPTGAEPYPVNRLPQSVTPHGMGGDLFVLGFPLSDQPLKLPIWKRASLASEPAIPENLQPYWLVDTASRSGMSGSPVIQRIYHDFGESYGSRKPVDRPFVNPGHRGKTSFCGVYTGRFEGKTDTDLQLGIVWPQQWIARLIVKHIGHAAYEAGLPKEHECAVHALTDLRSALDDPPYARKTD